MKLFNVRFIFLFALALFSGTTWAGLGNLSPDPLSRYWYFDLRLPGGEIEEIETITEAPWSRKAKTFFHRLDDGGLRVREREATIDYDDRGRVVRIVSLARSAVKPGEKPRMLVRVERATYGDGGVLRSAEQRYDNEAPTALTIESTEHDDGSRTISWNSKFQGKHDWIRKLTFDKEGRLIRSEGNPPGSTANLPHTYKYNEHCDIVAVTMGKLSEDRYEYEYDERGNWTSRTRTTVRGPETKQQETVRRTIKYGTPTPAPKNDPLLARAGGGGEKPVPADPMQRPMPDGPPPPPQAGALIYGYERGERGGFFNQMTVVLNPDHSLSWTIVTELRGQTTNKTSLGTGQRRVIPSRSRSSDWWTGHPCPRR